MILLAQDTAFIERLFNQGVAVALVVVGVLFLWKYGGKLVDRLIAFFDGLVLNLAANTEQTKSTKEAITNMVGLHAVSSVGTNRAVLALSRAARAACEHMPDPQKRIVLKHLDEIEEIFRAQH